MQEEPIFGNSGIKIILIDKKEYYLIYNHDSIPPLTQEKYDSIITNKEQDLNLGTILLYDKQKTKDGRYIRITPRYRQKHQNVEMDVDMDDEDENEKDKKEEKEGILMTDAINLNLLESDFTLVNKVMMILEGRNSVYASEKPKEYYNFPYLNNKNNPNPGNKQEHSNQKKSNDILKLDMNEKKLKIISIVNKAINLILFTIDINVDYVNDLSELFELSMRNFKHKANMIKEIEKTFNTNLKIIDDLNLKKTTITRIYKEKSEKLMNFIVKELNEKKKKNYALNEKISTLFTTSAEEKNNKKEIEEEKDDDKESDDISLGSIANDLNDDDIINTNGDKKEENNANGTNEGDNKNNNNNENNNKAENDGTKNNENKGANMNMDEASNDSNLSLTDL